MKRILVFWGMTWFFFDGGGAKATDYGISKLSAVRQGGVRATLAPPLKYARSISTTAVICNPSMD